MHPDLLVFIGFAGTYLKNIPPDPEGLRSCQEKVIHSFLKNAKTDLLQCK